LVAAAAAAAAALVNIIIKTRELMTARRHLMPVQQHLYNGLACPAN